MTTALSTEVVTPFGNSLHGVERHAIGDAQGIADRNQCPCGVWARHGWFTVCEVAPEMIEPNPELSGWVLWAVVDPMAVDAR